VGRGESAIWDLGTWAAVSRSDSTRLQEEEVVRGGRWLVSEGCAKRATGGGRVVLGMQKAVVAVSEAAVGRERQGHGCGLHYCLNN
jgi:hypothetical protein